MQIKLIAVIGLVILFYSCGKKTAETKPIRKDIKETVFASGVLEANATYNLVAQNEGYLIALNFEEGDIVSKNKTLAIIDNKESKINSQSADELLTIAEINTSTSAPLLAQAISNIAITKQKMEQDAMQEDRHKRLWQKNSIAKIDYENSILAAKTSRTNYDSALENYKKIKSDAEQSLVNNRTSKQINSIVQTKNYIKALVSGKVFEKKKNVGDFVKKGDVLAVIGDPNFIYAKLNVDESSIGKIKINQEAIVQLNTNKDKSYKALVYEFAPSFDETSQSFICKLKFVDTLDFTIVKTQLQANITIGSTKDALLIPRNYIDFGGNVMVKGKKNPVKVTTKFISNQWVQILSGIDEHTVLITEITSDIENDNSENDIMVNQ